jgi:hypothetical protein
VLAGFLLLPWYAKRELPRVAEEQLHQRARVGEIAFNPFTLRLRATDFALEEKDGRPILGFGEAYVALDSREARCRPPDYDATRPPGLRH